ncbi:hypothetical protein FACS189427_10490 [Planctomycetales bacterium]|nr:hypothetical protein FACS189427_10490 [Planctomycetales bacterium]
MPYKQFDRSRLKLKPIAERIHDLDLSVMRSPESLFFGTLEDFDHPSLDILADRICKAKQNGSTVLWMLGAHVLRSGNAPILVKLLEEGYITHIALNGAGSIHDFEFAMIGATTESVAKYISEGQFGLWNESGQLNEVAKEAAADGIGFGEAVGRWIDRNDFPYKKYSLLWNAYKLQIPVTVHIGIGCDFIHEHPNCDGAALGKSSYTDFLIYTQSITNLEGGVFCNFGSGVIGPEVYLKALSMSRNAAHQEGRKIVHFTTAVFDVLPLEGKDVNETPPKSDPRYYFRPWKTVLSRTVADGGESYYICGEHKKTVPALAKKILVR